MAGKIHHLIQEIMRKRTKGNPGLEHFVKAQLMMKGIDPGKYGPGSDDDLAVIQKLQEMSRKFDR